LDLTPFAAQTAHDVDFNGTQKGDVRHRGAYAGPGARLIWQPQPGMKPQP
jgi:hypothetical protein